MFSTIGLIRKANGISAMFPCECFLGSGKSYIVHLSLEGLGLEIGPGMFGIKG